MWRAVVAGISVIVAVVSGVVTALVTAHPSRGLWVALGVVVLMGATLQAVLTYGERRQRRRVDASGVSAVAIGGSSSGEIRTRVHGSNIPTTVPEEHDDGVIASGPGAVGIGGDASGPISTEVSGGKANHHDD